VTTQNQDGVITGPVTASASIQLTLNPDGTFQSVDTAHNSTEIGAASADGTIAFSVQLTAGKSPGLAITIQQ